MPGEAKIAIISAMEREVWPLVKLWPAVKREHDGRSFKFFEGGGTVAVCCGIGAEFGRRATEAVIQLYRPQLVISAGFAGALRPELPAGSTIRPRIVIDAADGSRTDTGSGEGMVVTFVSVAHAAQKAMLARVYGADAVDMEGAAIARGAQARGVRFVAIKAISDGNDTKLPPVEEFVGADGQLQFVRFAFYLALRPWTWASALRLARDSVKASQSLCKALAAILEMRTEEPPPGLQASVAVKL